MPAPSLASRSEASERRIALADPKLYAELRRYVQGRVPRGDAEDVVHAALTDALAAETAPAGHEDLRRWVYAIARNKVADFYRRNRHQRGFEEEADDLPADSAPHAASDLLKWAVKELPKDRSAHDTLEWMLREGDGDPLEEIAKENQLPAPRLRQRVSRLRRYYRSRWTAHLAALGLLTLLGVVGYRWHNGDSKKPDVPPIARENPSPAESARALRRQALDDCERARFEPCLERLSRADHLDPRGANAPEVRAAREAATRALHPTVAPTPSALTPTAPAPAPTVLPRRAPTPAPSSLLTPSPSSDVTSPKPHTSKTATFRPNGPSASPKKTGMTSSDFGSEASKPEPGAFDEKK